MQLERVSHCRQRQAHQQLGLPAAFALVEACKVVEVYTGFGVVQVPLPDGEFLVGLVDPVGVRRYGVVRFEGLADDEGWSEH